MVESHYLTVDWPAADNVTACTTLRHDGASVGDYAGFNLASHVGDQSAAVMANRRRLVAELGLPAEPVWLNQVHSNKVCDLGALPVPERNSMAPVPTPTADASISRNKARVCAVLTADCLPVFISNREGSEVAVAHAGWRGLHAGVIRNTVVAMRSAAEELLVALGPAIGPASFEVGQEVYDAFTAKSTVNADAFSATDEDHYLCDLYALARHELAELGIVEVYGGSDDSYRDARFYSYRRQPQTGRMASLIWLR